MQVSGELKAAVGYCDGNVTWIDEPTGMLGVVVKINWMV
jgi:hypothetical protein